MKQSPTEPCGAFFTPMKKILASAILIGSSLAVNASCIDSKATWQTLQVGSVHPTDPTMNPYTLGVGREWECSPTTKVVGGHYYNSLRSHSLYAGMAWLTPGSVRMGVVVGGVTGYSYPIAPLAAWVFSVEGETAGLNLLITPPVKGYAVPSVTLQLKAKLP